MFAVLALEREPLKLKEFWSGLGDWVQVVGSVAAVCLLFWLIGLPLRKSRTTDELPHLARLIAFFGFTAAVLGYLGLLIVRAPDLLALLSQLLGGEEPAIEPP